jgi:hypothetical protein
VGFHNRELNATAWTIVHSQPFQPATAESSSQVCQHQSANSLMHSLQVLVMTDTALTCVLLASTICRCTRNCPLHGRPDLHEDLLTQQLKTSKVL